MQGTKSITKSIFGLVVHLRRGSICYIGGSDTLPAPLTREEEIALMGKMAAGDASARSTLIERESPAGGLHRQKIRKHGHQHRGSDFRGHHRTDQGG